MSEEAILNKPTTEEKAEPVSNENDNIIVNIIEKTIIDLLKKSLVPEGEEMKSKLNIKLTPEIVSIINNIISLSPKTLTDIETAVVEIIKDSKIDSKDIPQLIVVIQKIYELIYSLKKVKFDANKRSEVTSTVLKLIVQILVLERKIKIEEEKQEEFLKAINILIDSCVGLLSFPKNLKSKGCLKKIFG